MTHCTDPLDHKRQQLVQIVEELGSVAVAFSGGVDSTVLLAVCKRVLGPERVLAVFADSPTYPSRERSEAARLADVLGVNMETIQSHELDNPCFSENPPDRCYYCKHELFDALWTVARARGLQAVVYGATVDDLSDHRPGMKAAGESGVRAPLLEAGLGKDDVRRLAQQMGLPVWDKPALACLASRFPYGLQITEARLRQVDAAENFLRQEFGLHQFRVRHHDSIARLEVEPEDFARLLDADARSHLLAVFKSIGYTYVTLDLAGFRSGSMNEVLRSGRGTE